MHLRGGGLLGWHARAVTIGEDLINQVGRNEKIVKSKPDRKEQLCRLCHAWRRRKPGPRAFSLGNSMPARGNHQASLRAAVRQ